MEAMSRHDAKPQIKLTNIMLNIFFSSSQYTHDKGQFSYRKTLSEYQISLTACIEITILQMLIQIKVLLKC